MIPMGERIRQAGDKAVPLLVELSIRAAAEAFQALEALDEDETSGPDIAEANRMPTSRIVGATADVVSELRTLAVRTGAHELMVTSVAYDLDARLRNLELLAEAWPLTAPA